MSLEKFKLFFSSTVGQDDEVKSFLFASDGTALTQTGGALDVNIASGAITVTEEDVYAEDAAHTSGDKGGFVLAVRRDTPTSGTSADGDYASLNVNADGELWVKDADVLAQLVSGVTVSATNLDIRDLVFATDKVDVSGSTVELGATSLAALENITVSATDLDIRDLAFATDKVDVSGSSVSITGTVAVTQSTSPWVVSSTNLDIRDLVAATDSVSAWTKDGAGNSIESIGGNLSVADCLQFGSLAAPALTSANTAVTVAAASDQKALEIQNLSNYDIFYGPVGTTTVGAGLLIPKKSVKEIKISGGIDLICATALVAGDIRVGKFIAS